MSAIIRYAKSLVLVLSFVGLQVSATNSNAATCTSLRTGNWSSPATWSCVGAPAATVPGAADAVVIASLAGDHVVTVDVNASALSVTFAGGGRGSSLRITNAAVALNVTGAIVINPSTSTTTTRQKVLAVGPGALSAASINITGGTSTTRTAQLTVSTGTITTAGSITFSGNAGGARLVSTGASMINIGGNLASGGTLTTNNTGTINFNGGVAQTMGGYATYNNVAINNTAGGVTLAGAVTINGNFSNNASFSNGANALNIAGNFDQSGTFTSGAGVVTLNGGARVQTISGTGPLGFANLTVSNTGGITLARHVTVSGAIIGAVTLTPTCPTDYLLTSNGGVTVAHSCPPPEVVSINTASINPTTTGATVSWTVTFNTPVTGVTASNFALVPGGGVTGATITAVTGTGAIWTVDANTGAVAGTLGLNMVNAADINPAVLTAMPFTGQVYTVNSEPLSVFDAFEAGGTLRAEGGPILTHIAGAAFSVDVVRVLLGPPPTINSTYNRTIIVDVVDASLPGFNCATAPAIVATVSPAVSTAMVNGKLTYSITVPAAYRNLRLRVDRNGTKTCAINRFAVRPNRLTSLAVQDTDWVSAGATRNLGNVSADVTQGCSAVGMPAGCTAATRAIHKAGQPFRLTATAVNSAGATASTYDGSPDAVVCVGSTTICINGRTLAADSLKATATQPTPAICTGTACIGNPGILTLGATAVAGVLTATGATYSEVGAFTLQLQDQQFANIDSGDPGTVADCSAMGRYVCSDSLNVGRFVPDHFALSASFIANRTDMAGCPAGCGVFSYMGEQMDAVFTLTAQGANNLTTTNYAGVLAKLNPTAAGALNMGAIDTPLIPPRAPLTARISTTGLPSVTGQFSSSCTPSPACLGTANVRAPFSISRGATADGPYGSLDVGIAPVDGDGVMLSPYDMDSVNLVEGAGNHALVGSTEVRYGRIKLSNAHGSELLALPLTATVQYWNGTYWGTSATDMVTSLTLAATYNVLNKSGSITGTTIPTPTGAATVANGILNISLSKPTGGAGSATVTPVGPGYLPLTGALATFGVYKGNNEFIYLRENY